MTRKSLWLETLSSTHVGTGRGLGYIDLPIHREKVTGWPMIPGSSIKGVIADSHQAGVKGRKDNAEKVRAFGTASGTEGESRAGSLLFSDARLVCLPVRSFSGTLAWCTTLPILQQIQREFDGPALPSGLGKDKAGTVDGSVLGTKVGNKYKVVLEEYDLDALPTKEVGAWADWIRERLFNGQSDEWKTTFSQRFAVLNEDLFNHLAETGTEVVTRVRIDEETGIVADGQLWTEESLPVGTILLGMIGCDPREGANGSALLDKFASGEKVLQFGGKASVGRGRIRCVFAQS
jgi:CRISPR-associated protein Cmr4